GDPVVIDGPNQVVERLRSTTGSTIWATDDSHLISPMKAAAVTTDSLGDVLVFGDNLSQASSDESLRKLDGLTGRLKWEANPNQHGDHPAAIGTDRHGDVFVASEDLLTKRSRENGAELWKLDHV